MLHHASSVGYRTFLAPYRIVLRLRCSLAVSEPDHGRPRIASQDGNVAAFCTRLGISEPHSLSHFPDELGSQAFCVQIWAPVKANCQDPNELAVGIGDARTLSYCVQSSAKQRP